MTCEQKYNTAFSDVRKIKKQYLTEVLEKENRCQLESIDLDDWSEKDREDAYQEEVLPYWKKFGLAPKRFWFELAGSRDHRMDPRFIPVDLLYTDIYPYMNYGMLRQGLMSKAHLEYIFSDVKQPPTVALKIEGVYLDEHRNLISKDDAIRLCRERNNTLFAKASTGTCSGKGITVFTPSSYSDEELQRILEEAGSSFIIQERIRQHPLMDQINPSSVATIRVVSLLMEDKVHILSGALRLSAPDSPFVTVLDGGILAEILDQGKLYPKVYADIGKWYENGKGIFDDSFQVPSIERVYDEVKRIHPRIANFKCVGWDIAIDETGDPVLLEYNVFPGPICPQTLRCKPLFNEHTDWILEDYFIHRQWEKNHRQDILIQ